MNLKITVGLTILALSTISGLIINDLTRMSPETLIMCVLDEGGIKIPSNVCEYYLYNYRDIEADVGVLAAGSGLSFILEGKDQEKKFKLAELYILHGLKVDSINHTAGYNITSLHGAVLDNDVDMARFLLSHGASKDIKDSAVNMTPLELAHSLQQKEPKTDRSQIIKILSN